MNAGSIIGDVRNQMSNRSRRGDTSGLNLELNRLHMRSAGLDARLRALETKACERGSGPLPRPQHEFHFH